MKSPQKRIDRLFAAGLAGVAIVAITTAMSAPARAQTSYEAGRSENVPTLDESDRGRPADVIMPSLTPDVRPAERSLPTVGSARTHEGSKPPAAKPPKPSRPPAPRPEPELRRRRPSYTSPPPRRSGSRNEWRDLDESIDVPVFTLIIHIGKQMGGKPTKDALDEVSGVIVRGFSSRRAYREALRTRKIRQAVLPHLARFGRIMTIVDGALDAHEVARDLYQGEYVRAVSDGTATILRGMTVDYFVAQGGVLVATSVGAPAIIGAGVAAAGGVLIFEYVGKPMVEHTVDMADRYNSLSEVGDVIDEAEAHLRNNEADDALVDAIRVLQRLQQVRASKRPQVGYSDWAMSLEGRAVRVQTAIALAHLAVSHTEAVIAGLISDARRGVLKNAGATIGAALKNRDKYELVGRSDLIKKLQFLPLTLENLMRAHAEKEKQKKDKKTTTVASARPAPRPSARPPARPSAQPRPASPRTAARPSPPPRRSLHGRGPWHSAGGRRRGTIMINIDVVRGRFVAGCDGQFQVNEGVFPFSGQFSGTYKGDSRRGTIQGTGTIYLSTDAGQNSSCRIQGRVENGVLSGTVTSPQGAETFRLPVR